MHQNNFSFLNANSQVKSQNCQDDNKPKLVFDHKFEWQFEQFNFSLHSKEANSDKQQEQKQTMNKQPAVTDRSMIQLQEFNQFLQCQFGEANESSSQSKQINSDSKQSDLNKKQKKQRQKLQNRCLFKNYLIVIKRCISSLLARYETKILPEQATKLIDSKGYTNRHQIEQIFNWESIRPQIAHLFLSKRIHQEIQLCRLSHSNQQLFRDKLRLMKKAFIRGKLPNL